ncbi:MAG: hypothetical protein HOD52_04040, partial [Candidatus Marinimicrobia bacterium]|nr:hypothetical protein [Candidatus Neomarinimicrobiota bacterium]
ILMSIEDDFGFSNLQLSYELERPNYIEAEPFISLFNIEINKSSKHNKIFRQFGTLNH